MLRLNTGLVTEDDFVNWVRSQNGVLHTRKVSNISTTNLSECPPNTIVCLTGYSQIVHIFFKDIIKNFKNKIILITLETDGFDMRNEYLSNPLLYHWFTWNKPIQHEKLTCIPIGLNFDRHHNSIVNYINGDNNNNIRDKLFAVNLSVSSNPDRIKLIQTAKTK